MSVVALNLNVIAWPWDCFGHKVSLKTKVGPCISVTNVKRNNDFPCEENNDFSSGTPEEGHLKSHQSVCFWWPSALPASWITDKRKWEFAGNTLFWLLKITMDTLQDPEIKKCFYLDSSEKDLCYRNKAFGRHSDTRWCMTKGKAILTAIFKNPLWVSGSVFIVWKVQWRHLHIWLPGWDTFYTAATSFCTFYCKLLFKYGTKIPMSTFPAVR